jgi:hypothetical protein
MTVKTGNTSRRLSMGNKKRVVHEVNPEADSIVLVNLPGKRFVLKLQGIHSDGVDLISITTPEERVVDIVTYPEEYNVFGMVVWKADNEDDE